MEEAFLRTDKRDTSCGVRIRGTCTVLVGARFLGLHNTTHPEDGRRRPGDRARRRRFVGLGGRTTVVDVSGTAGIVGGLGGSVR
jgi:hypothetical protein